jgi:hypothetical protein
MDHLLTYLEYSEEEAYHLQLVALLTKHKEWCVHLQKMSLNSPLFASTVDAQRISIKLLGLKVYCLSQWQIW